MPKFYVTFDKKYRLESHPKMGGVDPDGYFTIIAPDFTIARNIAFDCFGYFFDIIYTEENFVFGAFPHGEMGCHERNY